MDPRRLCGEHPRDTKHRLSLLRGAHLRWRLSQDAAEDSTESNGVEEGDLDTITDCVALTVAL